MKGLKEILALSVTSPHYVGLMTELKGGEPTPRLRGYRQIRKGDLTVQRAPPSEEGDPSTAPTRDVAEEETHPKTVQGNRRLPSHRTVMAELCPAMEGGFSNTGWLQSLEQGGGVMGGGGCCG